MAFLEQAWKSGRPQLIPIYGRRRIGKSELIRHFTADKPALYLVGKQSPSRPQLQELMEVGAQAFPGQIHAEANPPHWKAALEMITQASGGKPFVLVLDEFQWLVQASPELPSVLQELWDRSWQRQGRMFIIVCGSLVGFMEREFLGSKSPLYGRRTGQIHIESFPFHEARQFLPRLSLSAQGEAYFICGGIPLYLLEFDDSVSVEMNIRRALLREHGTLHREPEFLLREELNEVARYHNILMQIGSRPMAPQEICRSTDIGPGSLPYYLNQLCALNYIERVVPLSERKPKLREVRYRIRDPFLRFWFRFVFPHLSQIYNLGPDEAFSLLIRPQLDSYYGSGFERLCRECLPGLYRRQEVRAAYEIGEYWNPRCQIDVVGLRKDNWVDLGECKWGSAEGAARELDRKAREFPNERGASIAKWIFTHRPLKSPPQGFRTASLEDLSKLPPAA